MRRRAGPTMCLVLLLVHLMGPPAGGALLRGFSTPRWHTLGTDVVGDWDLGHVDITAVRVRQTPWNLLLRFHFRDLPAVPPPGAKIGAHLSRDGAQTPCCFIRGDLGPTQQHSLTFGRAPCGIWSSADCSSMELRGRYEAQKDHLTLFLPLPESGFRSGDVIAGCPPPDGEGRCERNSPAVCTSPTNGMYGYDGVVITAPYTVK